MGCVPIYSKESSTVTRKVYYIKNAILILVFYCIIKLFSISLLRPEPLLLLLIFNLLLQIKYISYSNLFFLYIGYLYIDANILLKIKYKIRRKIIKDIPN